MSNSNGFIITGIVIGLSLILGGTFYLSNKSIPKKSVPTTFPSKEEQGYFYSGGNLSKKIRNKKKNKTIKNK